MRKNIVAGNWKMNNDLAATKTLISELIELEKDFKCRDNDCSHFCKSSGSF